MAATVALIGLLLSTPLVSAADGVPERDLRESAERILSDPAFQDFERFPKGAATPETAPSESTSGSASQSESQSQSGDDANSRSASPPANWWDRLRQRGKNGKRSSEGTSSSPSDGQSSERSGTEPSPRGSSNPSGDKASSQSPAEGTTPQRPGDKPSSEVARPQRPAAERTPPSQRGHDGVTRPVRFAPKVRTPTPSRDSSSDWNINLGGLSGLGSVLGGLLHGLAYVALAAVCALIVILVVRAVSDVWKSREARGVTSATSATPLAHDRSPGETEADVFLHEALLLAEAGQYRPALAQLVLGAMSTIERRQWIRYRRGLTLNDYVRSVRSRPEQLTGLRSVIDSYEPVEFGRRTATETVFATALDGYRTAFTGFDPM